VSETPDPVDPKEKFKAALEKKKSQNKRSANQGASEGNSKLHAASGNKPKMFRRKSG
jgi:hypothetical protein